jgi:hypothetical protein
MLIVVNVSTFKYTSMGVVISYTVCHVQSQRLGLLVNPRITFPKDYRTTRYIQQKTMRDEYYAIASVLVFNAMSALTLQVVGFVYYCVYALP